uniref:Uncharacterized protein n=1 Tax=Ciona savignyi TaxID=51511 RepID=H2YS96_CIOSA
MLDDVQSQTITNNDPTMHLLNNSELCTIGNCDESLLVFVEQSDSSTSSGMFTSDDSELGKISKVCANCSNKGNPVTLQLFQLNFNEAICMCIEDDCQYPLFEEDLSSYIIQQDIYEVTQSRKK